MRLIIFIYRNLPNILTFVRLIGGIFILPILIFYFLSDQFYLPNLIIAIIFALFSATDFLDGYLARKYQIETNYGKILDPIADKFLVCSALITLLAIQKIYFLWVVILIGRELAIASMRHLAAERGLVISVSYFGKIKAALQMILIFVIIAKPLSSFGLISLCWVYLENILLVLTLFFALSSFYGYSKLFKYDCLGKSDEKI